MGQRVDIRVLGAVELRSDGRPVHLSRQEATVLSLLVAAEGHEVPRSELMDALWGAAPDRDLLSPVLSRLRRRLVPGGLTISRGVEGVGHRLVPGPSQACATVDAQRLTGLVEQAERALDGDDPATAARLARRAAELWRGRPFGLPAPSSAPARLRRAAERLEAHRRRSLRAWARAGLRTETHDLLLHDATADVASAGDAEGDLWLLTVVRALASGGADQVEKLVDFRRRTTGRYDDDLVARAFGLLRLAERGVPIRSRGTGRGGGRLQGGPIDAVVDQLTAETPLRERAVLRAEGAPDVLVARYGAAADATGAVLAAATGPAPLAALARRLQTFVLRDRGLRVDPRRVVDDLDAAETDPLVDDVAALLDRVAARHRVLVVAPEIDEATAQALLDRCRSRRVAVVCPGDRVSSAGRRPELAPSARPDRDTWATWACAAAVIEDGERIDPVLVHHVLDDAETGSEVESALAAAVADRFVVAEEAGFRFADEDARREALRLLWSDPPRARALHRAAYRVLAQGLVPHPARLAEHAWRSRPLLSDAEVAHVHLVAARELRERGEGNRAVALVDRGLALTAEDDLQFGLLLCRGDAHHAAGRMDLAAQAFRDALAGAPSLPQRAEAALRLARRWTDPGRSDAELIAVLREVLEELADDGSHGDLELRVRAHLAHKATMALPEADPGATVAEARRVLDASGAVADAESACDVLVECRWTLFDHVPPAEARAVATLLEQRSLDAGSVHYRGEALICGIVDDLRLGDLDSARRATEVHRDLVHRHGHGLGPRLERTLDTLFDLWDGRLADARRRLGTSAPPAPRTGADSVHQTWLGQQFWSCREQGRSADLLGAPVGEQVARRHFFPVWAAGTALLLADTGLATAALDQVESVLAQVGGPAALPAHGWSVPTLALLAESVDVLAGPARGRTEAPARARELAGGLDEALAAHDGEIILAGWPTVLLGPVARFRAQLALVLGRSAAVPALLADLPPGALSPYQRAWLRTVEARAALVDGRTADAADLAAAALSVAEHHGAALLRNVASTVSATAGPRQRATERSESAVSLTGVVEPKH